jgi:hypothetical protein
VTVDEFRYKLLLALADELNRIIKADKVMVNILHELEQNFLLRIAISPATGLLDASGKFNPD